LELNCEFLQGVRFSTIRFTHAKQSEEIEARVRAAKEGGLKVCNTDQPPIVFTIWDRQGEAQSPLLWLNHNFDSLWFEAVTKVGFRGTLLARFQRVTSKKEWITNAIQRPNETGIVIKGHRFLSPAERISVVTEELMAHIDIDMRVSKTAQPDDELKDSAVNKVRDNYGMNNVTTKNTTTSNIISGAAPLALAILKIPGYSDYYIGIIRAAVDAASRRAKQCSKGKVRRLYLCCDLSVPA